jgi:hypothetical protein
MTVYELSHKKVTSKHASFTKAEREYVKGLVRNLSLQRLTDREKVQWLRDEKQIDLDRSTISKMRLQVQKDATKWYVGIRESGSKYVAIYKERLDSLLYYQKRLNEIVDSYLPEHIYPSSIDFELETLKPLRFKTPAIKLLASRKSTNNTSLGELNTVIVNRTTKYNILTQKLGQEGTTSSS